MDGYDFGDDLVLHQNILTSTLNNAPGIVSRENVTSNFTEPVLHQETILAEIVDNLDVELFKGYSTTLLRFASVCFLLFMLVGIPGNLITIIALFRCKKVRNATAVFIINLSVSDLMSCCFNLPLAASTFWQRAWRHGHLLCQLFPLLRYGLLAVSLFTVLAITINRYVMIGHPTLYPKLYQKQYLGLMVACTWLCGFGALVATWLGKWGRFGLDPAIGSCSILPDQYGRSPKEFLFVVAFVIPCIAIVVCYARIFYIVRKTALKSRLATRNSAPTASQSAVTTTQSKSSCYYSSGRVRLLRKANMSSTEDSALGSSSTGPSYSTEKSSSFLDNGNSTEMSADTLTIRMVTLNRPNPNLLSPPSLSPSKFTKILADPSSSSGVEGNGYDEDDEATSRSVSPTSLCSSMAASSPKTRGVHRKHRKERMPSAVNSTLSHVASVFRKSSNLKSSPRRTSSNVPPTPGKMTPKDTKLLKMILVIFASFLTCYLPITISKTFRDYMESKILNIAGYILIYLTTCINPIIYVVMSSEYRQAYKNLLMCRTSDAQGQIMTVPARSSSQRA